MAGWLTTHVLDTARGRPAAGLTVTLNRLTGAYELTFHAGDWLRAAGGAAHELAQAVTNADGRTDAPILPQAAFEPGAYELIFHAGDWLRAEGLDDGFLDVVPIRFRMTEAAHYHVPLLLSPFGYSTYRGS